MDIQTKDGIILRGIPDGTPEEEIKERISQIRAGGGQRQKLSTEQLRQQIENDPISRGAREASKETKLGNIFGETVGQWLGGNPDATLPQRIAAAPGTRFAMGAASPVIGGAQLLANMGGTGDAPDNLFSNSRLQQLEQMKKAGGNEGADLMGLAGTVMSPAGLAAMKIAPAATFGGRVGQGAAIGAGAGALTPVADGGENFWTDKAAQTGGGAALGAAIPIGIDAIRGGATLARNVVDPWLPGGVERTAGRTLNEAAGTRRAAVMRGLTNPIEFVQGSRPNAGEAASKAGSAEFSGIQEIVKGRFPSEYDEIARTQAQARANAIRGVGGTRADIQVAEGAREGVAGPMYQSAGKEILPINNTQFSELMRRPSMEKAIARAQELAEEKGKSFTIGKDVFGQQKPVSVENMQFIKMALDDLVKNPERFGIGASESGAIQGTRGAFVDWLSKQSPNWAAARTTYADMSKPINQMQVGQYLEQKLTSPMAEQGAGIPQRAAMYAQAMRDAPGTLKRATGTPRYEELGDVLNAAQLGTVENVGRDLARSAEQTRLGGIGKEKARLLLGDVSPSLPAAGMFSPNYSVLRAISNRLAGRVEGKSLDALAKAMQDPAEAARLMDKADPATRRMMVQLLGLQNTGRATVIGGATAAAQE